MRRSILSLAVMSLAANLFCCVHANEALYDVGNESVEGNTIGGESFDSASFESAKPQMRYRPVRQEQEFSLLDELTFLAAIDGSKQPQDFGVNAVTGGQFSFNLGVPLISDYGIGMQVGSGITAAGNAVRVYEALGETTSRTQNFTSVGLFQRTDNGFAWGFTHDFLNERYFDRFTLSQWRFRVAYDISDRNQVGFTGMLRGKEDTGVFGTNTSVRLRSIDQAQIYLRHYWATGAQTSVWAGVADGHGENNAVLGRAPGKDDPFLFGSDVLMPLTKSLAIYGETNFMMPMDTGVVDAFLGVQWYPRANAFCARRGKFSPLMSLASPVAFAVDLLQP